MKYIVLSKHTSVPMVVCFGKQPLLSPPPLELCNTKGNWTARVSNAPGALLVCRRIHYLKTHSNHVILCAEVSLVMTMPSFHKWRKAAPSKLGWFSPECNLTNSTKQEVGSFHLSQYSLLSVWTPAPMVVCFRKQLLTFSHKTCDLCYTNGE